MGTTNWKGRQLLFDREFVPDVGCNYRESAPAQVKLSCRNKTVLCCDMLSVIMNMGLNFSQGKIFEKIVKKKVVKKTRKNDEIRQKRMSIIAEKEALRESRRLEKQVLKTSYDENLRQMFGQLYQVYSERSPTLGRS